MRLITKNGVYYVNFRAGDGEIKSISTRTKNLDEALKIVRESGLQELEIAAKAGRLTKEAIGHLLASKETTVSIAADEYEQWLKAQQRSPKTIRNYVFVLQQWLADAGISSLPPVSVSQKHVDEWVNRPGVLQPSTRQLHLSTIQSFFGFLANRGLIVGNPARLVSVRATPDTLEDLGGAESFSSGEIATLQLFLAQEVSHTEEKLLCLPAASVRGRAVLDGRIRQFHFWSFAVPMSLHCGLRLGCIAKLEWAFFEKPGEVMITTRKRQEPMRLPLREELVVRLRELPKRHERFLFPEEAMLALDPKRTSILSVQFGRILNMAGIDGKSFEGLRLTFQARASVGPSGIDNLKDLTTRFPNLFEGGIKSSSLPKRGPMWELAGLILEKWLADQPRPAPPTSADSVQPPEPE